MSKNLLEDLYFGLTGTKPAEITELPASGSNRRYFRLSGPASIIGAVGTSRDENNAFIYLAEHFAGKGLPVPKVLAVSEDRMAYLQEDLGDLSLFAAIEKGRLTRSFSTEEKDLISRTIKLLPDIQFRGAENLDFKICYPSEAFDRRSIMWDLNYFKYCFLKATGLEFQEDLLEDDFQKMATVLLKDQGFPTFMYRDFQSRNVMIKDGEPHFIDFQGGRKGPFFYDLASFLWQAKANFPDTLREELIDDYITSLRKYIHVDREKFFATLRHFVLFRTLQVLGAYGFRGYFEKKPHFMQSVPFAIANLRELLKNDYTEYPYLQKLLHELVNLKQFSDELQKRALTVRVFSFAYKKGIPDDPSGNGGGYVFDCRGIDNPGKYERYKPFTGLDAEVIKYIEEVGEVFDFLNHCYALVDNTVRRYMERSFTSLMVSFGCTGGQHRSVYCAQHLAEHINRLFNVKVELIHREQNIEQIFNPKG